MAHLIKVTANVSGAIGKDDLKTILVNLDHVTKITPDDTNGGCKITYDSGQTDRITESRDLIEKLYQGVNVGQYIEPEPNAKDA